MSVSSLSFIQWERMFSTFKDGFIQINGLLNHIEPKTKSPGVFGIILMSEVLLVSHSFNSWLIFKVKKRLLCWEQWLHSCPCCPIQGCWKQVEDKQHTGVSKTALRGWSYAAMPSNLTTGPMNMKPLQQLMITRECRLGRELFLKREGRQSTHSLWQIKWPIYPTCRSSVLVSFKGDTEEDGHNGHKGERRDDMPRGGTWSTQPDLSVCHRVSRIARHISLLHHIGGGISFPPPCRHLKWISNQTDLLHYVVFFQSLHHSIIMDFFIWLCSGYYSGAQTHSQSAPVEWTCWRDS